MYIMIKLYQKKTISHLNSHHRKDDCKFQSQKDFVQNLNQMDGTDIKVQRCARKLLIPKNKCRTPVFPNICIYTLEHSELEIQSFSLQRAHNIC